MDKQANKTLSLPCFVIEPHPFPTTSQVPANSQTVDNFAQTFRSTPPPPPPPPRNIDPNSPLPRRHHSAPTGPPGKAEVVPSAACPWRACTLAAGQSHWEVEGSHSPGAVRRAEIVPANYSPGTTAEMKQGPRRGLQPPMYRAPPTRPRPVKSGKDYPQN